MKKNNLFVLFVLALVSISLSFMGGCAQQQVTKDTGVQEAQAQEAPAEAGAVKPEEPAGPSEDALAEEARRNLQIQMEAFESVAIYFDFDKSELKPEAQDTLRLKANWLDKNPGFLVRIEGHCDERGTNEYNLALGERRASAARDFLVNMGVSADRIRTISYGEERPADPGHNEVAWARNRRDEFKLFK